MNTPIRYRGYMQCLRWAGGKEFIRSCAMICDLDIVINEEKGFLQTTLFYKTTGTREQIDRFKTLIKKGIDEYER